MISSCCDSQALLYMYYDHEFRQVLPYINYQFLQASIVSYCYDSQALLYMYYKFRQVLPYINHQFLQAPIVSYCYDSQALLYMYYKFRQVLPYINHQFLQAPIVSYCYDSQALLYMYYKFRQVLPYINYQFLQASIVSYCYDSQALPYIFISSGKFTLHQSSIPASLIIHQERMYHQRGLMLLSIISSCKPYHTSGVNAPPKGAHAYISYQFLQVLLYIYYQFWLQRSQLY